MTKRIFYSIFLVTFAVLLAAILLIMGVLYDYFSGVQREQLKEQTLLAAQGTAHEGLAYFTDMDSGAYRITWIGADGSVLYDSQANAEEMENHLDREEIREALEKGYGESSRYSATLTERMLYSAERLPDGSVIRLSGVQYTMFTLLLAILQPMLVIILGACILALFLAARLSKRIVGPLNDFDLDSPGANEAYPELAPLVARLESQQQQLLSRSAQLRQRQEELATVTDNMSEGLVLLNERGTIISINRCASELLGMKNAIGKSAYTAGCAPEILALVDGARGGLSTEKQLDLGEGRYQISVSPIITDAAVTGIAIVIFDMTEKDRTEQMRREFTANVSHELKTPLHSISGCAELMKNGMVKPEDIGRFSGQIYSEAQRMIRLVDDIIKLSRLDEGDVGIIPEDVDVYKLAEETVNRFAAAALEAGITLTVSGESAVIKGVPQQISAIILNLCDNAVKYNRQGGRVEVEVKKEPGKVLLRVSDTGIGIPPEHQERIFERFYRVDKSHSKEVGGTGLGLSIVKHAARLHHADIELKSKVGKGTEIRVIFPAM